MIANCSRDQDQDQDQDLDPDRGQDQDQDQDQDQIVAPWQAMVRAEPALHMAMCPRIRRVQLPEVDGKPWVILSQRIASSATMMFQARVAGKWSFTTMVTLLHVWAVYANPVFT